MIPNGDGPRDKPEDYFALLRGLNRLQKWAERNLMKFNNKHTWGNQMEIIVAEPERSVGDHVEHEPKQFTAHVQRQQMFSWMVS